MKRLDRFRRSQNRTTRPDYAIDQLYEEKDLHHENHHAATIALLCRHPRFELRRRRRFRRPAKTRAQVQAELVEAQRTGYVMDAKSGKMLNELYPNLYPARSKRLR